MTDGYILDRLKKSGDVLNAAYRQSFKKDHISRVSPSVFEAARSFSLDKAMSEFLSHLTYAAFPDRFFGDAGMAASDPYSRRRVDELRKLSRLPYPTTWIEYDMVAFCEESQKRYFHEMVAGGEGGSDGRMGLLIETIGADQFRMTCHFSDGEPTNISYEWSVSDSGLAPSPCDCEFARGDADLSLHCFGIPLERYPFVKIVNNGLFVTHKDLHERMVHIVQEVLYLNRGILLRVFSLLATLNDIPVSTKRVSLSKGFIARGKYRRYLDHQLVTIEIPKRRDARRLAKAIVSIARRRGHDVRGHFREVKPGLKKWIAAHVRGDASLGWVTHSYAVEHAQKTA